MTSRLTATVNSMVHVQVVLRLRKEEILTERDEYFFICGIYLRIGIWRYVRVFRFVRRPSVGIDRSIGRDWSAAVGGALLSADDGLITSDVTSLFSNRKRFTIFYR